MMLTKYGTDNIISMLIIAVLLIAIGYFIPWRVPSIILYISGLLLIGFTFLFFRDPDRQIPEEAYIDHSTILAPADGKVVQIIETVEKSYLDNSVFQISIFLSPLNVHVNRIPVNGIVQYFKYLPGDYLVASYPKASEKNEQTHIGVETQFGKILFKQIVGIVARRLVWDIKEGDTVRAGDRFGMMKFGSRMDVLISIDSEILVKVGDNIVAGETIIAKMNKNLIK